MTQNKTTMKLMQVFNKPYMNMLKFTPTYKKSLNVPSIAAALGFSKTTIYDKLPEFYETTMRITLEKQKGVLNYENSSTIQGIAKSIGAEFGIFIFCLIFLGFLWSLYQAMAYFSAMAALISKKLKDRIHMQEIRGALAKFRFIMDSGANVNDKLVKKMNYYLELDFDTMSYDETKENAGKIKKVSSELSDSNEIIQKRLEAMDAINAKLISDLEKKSQMTIPQILAEMKEKLSMMFLWEFILDSQVNQR